MQLTRRLAQSRRPVPPGTPHARPELCPFLPARNAQVCCQAFSGMEGNVFFFCDLGKSSRFVARRSREGRAQVTSSSDVRPRLDALTTTSFPSPNPILEQSKPVFLTRGPTRPIHWKQPGKKEDAALASRPVRSLADPSSLATCVQYRCNTARTHTSLMCGFGQRAGRRRPTLVVDRTIFFPIKCPARAGLVWSGRPRKRRPANPRGDFAKPGDEGDHLGPQAMGMNAFNLI